MAGPLRHHRSTNTRRTDMPTLTIRDDRDRTLLFSAPPKRVVSLVPSDTLSVCDLGCASALVGRTDYCILPESIASVPSIGGTKNPRVADLLALQPDLVLANQEENSRADLEQIAQAGIRIFVSFPKRVADGLAHLGRLAQIFSLHGDSRATALLKQGYEAHRQAEATRKTLTPLRTFCPIWMDPLMTINGDTFISDMMDLAGATNVFATRVRRYPLAADLGNATPLDKHAVGDRDTRYPRVTMDEVNALAPELVLLPDEPHPFGEAEARVFAAQDTPAAKRGAIVHADGQDLCWYGSRSVTGIARVCALVAKYR
jgi:ABC-type Fe3+-hydroxamate transport system substrate-binding protein